MDLFDIAVARKLSGGGGGGNPNTVKTVTGTMTVMFGDINLADLNSKLSSYDAEVHVVCDASALGAGTINAVLMPYGEGFSANGGNIMSTYTSGYVATWNSAGTLTSFKMFQGTTINDVTAYASAITTTMTVIYHPL